MLERHPAAEKVDLEGRLVLPGFNDSHLHLFEYALEKSRLSLRAARSAAEVIAAGRMRLKKTRDIVVGVGYNDALFAGSRPLTRTISIKFRRTRRSSSTASAGMRPSVTAPL